MVEQVYVFGGIPGDRNQVGFHTSSDGTDPVLPTHEFGSPPGSALDRLHGRQPMPDVVGKLPGVVAMRKNSGVSAERNLHASLDRLLETCSLSVSRHGVLVHHLGGVSEFLL